MAGCKDINEYVNQHLPLPSPWEKTSDREDTWYVNEDTKESVWVRPDNDVFQAVVNRIKDGPTEKKNALDKLFTRSTKDLIDLLGTPAIQLCFGEDKERKIKELEDAAEKEIDEKKEAAAKILRKGAGAQFASSANKTKISPKSITEIYGILDKLYKDKKDFFQNKKATNIQRLFRGHKTRRNQAALWTRHSDKESHWFTSDNDRSVWVLPEAAKHVVNSPNYSAKKIVAKKFVNTYRQKKCFKLLDLCEPPGGWKEFNDNEHHKSEMNEVLKKRYEDALELLDKNQNIELNCHHDNNVTPLMWASSFSQELAKKLIEMGADINKRDYLGSTALIYAVHGKKASTALLLIEKGANINLSTKITGDSDILYSAIDYTYNKGTIVPELKDVHDALLKKGAKPNEQTLKRIQKAAKRAAHGGSYRNTRKLRKNNRMTRRLR